MRTEKEIKTELDKLIAESDSLYEGSTNYWVNKAQISLLKWVLEMKYTKRGGKVEIRKWIVRMDPNKKISIPLDINPMRK